MPRSSSLEEIQLKIDACLNKMKNFLNANKLTMNEAKTTITKIMVLQKRAQIKGSPPYIEVTNSKGETETIKAGSYTRILGCNIRDNLSFKAHFETGEKNLLGECRKKLGTLKYLGKQLPKSCRKTLAQGLVFSRVNYLAQHWGSATPNYLNKLQSLVNNTARYIREGSFKKNTHIWPSGPTGGGGGSAKIPTSLTDFFSDIIELYELQNKVSIQNMLCYLYELTVTAEVGADLFNFGLTVYSTNA